VINRCGGFYALTPRIRSPDGGSSLSGDEVNLATDGAVSPIELLEMAVRFRQHARLFRGDPLEEHLKRLAEELENRARQFTKW
jgi:hypothetical protein